MSQRSEGSEKTADFKIKITTGTVIPVVIIQQIVTLSKYGHDALDICHP